MAAGDSALSLVINIAAVDSASAVINGVMGALKNLPGPLGGIVSAAAGVGAALGVAVDKAGTFQQSMNQIVTSAGESATAVKNSSGQIVGGIQMVSDGVKKMAIDTGTSTQDLASAMYYIESSGRHGAAGLQELQVAAEGAKTENANLTTVAKALTVVMTDYHLPVTDSAAAMNGLITAVKNGETNLQDLSGAMGQVLPIASSLGISFPQVAGALSEMTNEGIPAQQGAQNLAHVLVALQAPSKVAVGSMKDVGLSAQQVRDALVSQGLPAALQMIEDHVGKKFPAGSVQATTALKNIMGGLVGLKLASELTGGSLQATKDDINKVAAAFDAGGTAVDGWDTVQQGFNFQMARAQQAINVLFITIGQQLLPILTPIVKGFADVVSGISNFVGALGSAKDPGDALVGILTSLGANMQTAKQVSNDLYVTLRILGDIAKNVGDAFQSVFGGAIQIVGGWITDFINGPLDSIVQNLNEVLQNIDDFAAQIPKSLQSTFDGLSSDAQTWGQNFGVGFENGLISVASDIIAVAEQIAQDIADYLGFASPTKKGPGSTLDRWGVGMITGLAQGITSAAPLVTDAVNGVAQQLQLSTGVGGSLHAAVASLIDPTSGDTMTATAIPSAVTSATSTAKSVAAKSSTSSTAPTQALVASIGSGAASVVQAVAQTANAVTTSAAKVASCSSPASTCASQAAAAAKAQKAATSAASAKQRSTLAATAAAQKAKTSAAAAAQRTAAAAAKAKTSAAAAKQRADQLAATKQAAAEAKAQAAAKAAAKKAAAAAAKAGPPAVAGALPNMGNITNALGGIQQAITNAFAPLKTAAANAKLMADNISNSFTGIQAKAQQLQSDLQQFFDFLQRTFEPVWQQMASTWENQIVPDLAKIKKALDDSSPSWELILGTVGKLIAIGLLQLLKDSANDMALLTDVIGRASDGLTIMAQQFLWLVQVTKPLWKAIADGATWLYNELIGHSIIPDIVNGIETWFNKLVSFLPNLANQFIAGVVRWWTSVKTTIATDAQSVWSAVSTAWNSIWTTYIQKPLASLLTQITTWWTTLKTDFATWTKNAWTAVQTAFGTVYQTYIQPALTKIEQSFQTWFTTETTNFSRWAGNLITSFGQGLTNGIPQLQGTLTNVANTIKSILGINSPAEVGPLSTADQWMPNLMNMFATQIKAKEPAITAEVNNFATGIANQFTTLSNKVQTNTSQINTSLSNLANQVTQAQQQTASQMSLLTQNVSQNTAQINNDMLNLSSQVQTNTAQMNGAIQASQGQMNQWVVQVGSTTQAVNSQVSQTKSYAQSSMQTVVSNVNTSSEYVHSTTQQTSSWVDQQVNQLQTNMQENMSLIHGLLTGNQQEITSSWSKIAGEWNASNAQFMAEGQAALNYAQSIAGQVNGVIAQAQAGAQSAAAGMMAAANAAAAAVKATLGFSNPPDQGPLSDSAEWMPHMMQMFASGITENAPLLTNAANKAALSVKTALSPTITATSSPTVNATTNNQQTMVAYFNLDGKALGKWTGRYINGELHAQGAIRSS